MLWNCRKLRAIQGLMYPHHFHEEQSGSQGADGLVEPLLQILVRGHDLQGVEYRNVYNDHAEGR